MKRAIEAGAGLVVVAMLAIVTLAAHTSATNSDLPVAPLIAAVSMSSPGPAQSALDACLITDSAGVMGSNGALGFDVVDGMGLVVPASSVPDYAPLWGIEPEIQTTDPAWVISIQGTINLPLAGQATDPTCVVVDGQHFWYATGPYERDGVMVTPMPAPRSPIFRLPPLVP